MSTTPRWLTYFGGAILGLLALGGVASQYVGPFHFNPPPAPPPSPVGDDNWAPLEAPKSNVVQGLLELPPPMEISSNRRYVPITAKCTNTVRWLVSSATGSVDVVENRLTNSLMIFPKPNADDNIAIVAYTAAEGRPTSSAVTFIAVKADKPPPGPTPPGPTPPNPPGPTPPNPPTPEPPQVSPTKLHVTFLLDFTKQTRAISDIINNKELRQWCKDKGHEIHELSIKDNLSALGLDEVIKGKQPPLLIVQTQAEPGIKEGQVLLVEPLMSATKIRDILVKLAGK